MPNGHPMGTRSVPELGRLGRIIFVDETAATGGDASAGSRQTSECWLTNSRKAVMDWAALKPWGKHNDREMGV